MVTLELANYTMLCLWAGLATGVALILILHEM